MARVRWADLSADDSDDDMRGVFVSDFVEVDQQKQCEEKLNGKGFGRNSCLKGKGFEKEPVAEGKGVEEGVGRGPMALGTGVVGVRGHAVLDVMAKGFELELAIDKGFVKEGGRDPTALGTGVEGG